MIEKKKSIFKIIWIYGYYLKKSIVQKENIISILYFTPHYFYYNLRNKTPLDLHLPWITISSYKFLKKILQKFMHVYEYGSGGSTLFFADRVKSISSIEHDIKWHKLVNEKVKVYNNIHYFLLEPESVCGEVQYKSGKSEYNGMDFYKYVSSIENHTDYYFDLIVIDGRSRENCLIHSISKLKKGGYILFDNAERQRYQFEIENIKDWLVHRSYGPTICDLFFSETRIYQKPVN